MRNISSRRNHQVQRLRSLRDAKGRADAGCFLVEGWNLLREALQSASIDTIVVDEAKTRELYGFLPEQPVPSAVFCAPRSILEYICETKTPQGVVASVQTPHGASPESIQGNVLALDGVQDPGNVGAMIRTAEAAGFGAVFLSTECADPFAPKTVRATMGSLFRTPLLRGNLPSFLRSLQRDGFSVVSAELGGMPVPEALRMNCGKMALVIGSEGNGVSNEVSTLSDLRVALPMRGRVASLNAAVAAGILMYALSFLPPDAPFSPYAK